MLQEYLAVLDQIELLSPEEEADLWRRYKDEDDIEARASIIEHYQPLVFREAKALSATQEGAMDCVQEGILGLLEAVERYDPSLTVSFAHYGRYRIRGRIMDYLRKEGRSDVLLYDDSEEEYWWEQLPDSEQSVEENVEQHAFAEVLRDSLDRLPQSEKLVLSSVYLGNQSIATVAAEMDRSESYIHRLHKRAIRRLRGMLGKTKQSWK